MEKASLHRQSIVSLLFGTAGLVVALFYIPQLFHTNFAVFLSLVFLATLLETMPIPMRQSLISLLPVVPIGAMVVYGLAPAMWIVIIAGVLAPLVLREWNGLIVYFNVGQYALSVLCMTVVFHLFQVNSTNFMTAQTLFAILISAVVFLIFNHMFTNILHAARGTLLISLLFSAMLTDIVNLAMYMPFALLMIAISPIHPLVGPMLILPIVILAYVLRVHRQTHELQAVHAATTRLASEFDARAIAEECAEITRRITVADVVAVFFVDHDRQMLVPKVIYPVDRNEGFWKEGYPEQQGGVIWKTIRGRDFVNIADTRKDKRVRFDGETPRFLSMAIFPMHAHMEVQGAIVCYAERPHAFGYSTKYVSALANQASVLLENARLYEELQERTRRDAATGLYNYRFFYEELGKRVTEAVRLGSPISVVIVDIDFFKNFNDTYGHLAGDAVLQHVGQLLANVTEAGSFAARYGGEEFALLLPVDGVKAYKTAEQIREAVRQLSIDFHGYKLQGITVSTGIASCPEHSEVDRDLLLKADSAMYWGAKQRGRNRTAMYTPEFDAQLFVDSLTGLYTIHLMNIRVREEILHGVIKWGVICLDLHQFGFVNQQFGFQVGDQVLRQTGVLIRECLRYTELACRYGGDEILVLLPGATEKEAETVKGRVMRAISGHRFLIEDHIVLSLHANATCQVMEDVLDGADLFTRVSDLFAQLQTEAEQSMA